MEASFETTVNGASYLAEFTVVRGPFWWFQSLKLVTTPLLISSNNGNKRSLHTAWNKGAEPSQNLRKVVTEFTSSLLTWMHTYIKNFTLNRTFQRTTNSTIRSAQIYSGFTKLKHQYNLNILLSSTQIYEYEKKTYFNLDVIHIKKIRKFSHCEYLDWSTTTCNEAILT